MDSIVLQDNVNKAHNLSALESSLNYSLAQHVLIEHAKNQGKINIENGIDDKVLDKAKGFKGDSKLAVSDMAA